MNARKYIVPGVITALSVLVIWASLQLDESPPMIVGDAMQPRVFPIFLMIVNLALVAVWVAQLYRDTPKAVARESFSTWGSMLLLVVFFLLTTYVDLFIAIAVVMFLMCLLWGERRIAVAAATALLTPLAIFILFDKVLQVRFPRGILMNWYYG